MTDPKATTRLLDRLRINLRAAEIPATEQDILGVAERGFLDSVLAFETLVAGSDLQTVPDHLSSWEPGSSSTVALAAPDEVAEPAAVSGSITEVAPRIRRREVSPVELTQSCLQRIGELDSELNAFQLVLAREAEKEARRAESEIAAGDYKGPLHGVPVAVKDLLDMAGIPTTGGSVVMPTIPAQQDAGSVRRLRDAGAIIVGKTRLSELAYSPGSNNAHYGPTCNPWNPAHDTGGSSSGSAAVVATNMAYAALGSDTGGSIRIPSGLCGLVGLKPTYGRVGMSGAISLSWSLDHLGPLTRSVADAALMLQVLAGPDAHDPRMSPGPEYVASSQDLQTELRGLRIGVLLTDGDIAPLGTAEALQAWRKGLAALEQAGADLEEIALPELSALRTLNSAILVLEAAAYHFQRMKDRLIEFGEFPRHRLLHAYAHGPADYVQAQQMRALLRRRVEETLSGLHLLSTPTMPDCAPLLGIPASIRYTAPFNILGWPAITVPVGATSQGLPLGLQLIGMPWDEQTVLRAARAVEMQLQPRLDQLRLDRP